MNRYDPDISRRYVVSSVRSPVNTGSSPKRRRSLVPVLIVVLILAAGVAYYGWHTRSVNSVKVATAGSISAGSVTVPAPVNYCAGNSLNQLILVSISKRHLWACSAAKVLYSSPVVTGMDYLAADLTPPGTYHIYAKETDLYLTGHDSTGSWNDFVHYWMPFLNNQYGTYGLHDATWREASAFGNISPGSSEASHGCVELPLATATWLYSWSQIGTTVTVES